MVIGLSLGVLGGGGSILTVPILVYVAGFEAKEAIAASLFVVGVTSAVSVFSHARGGRVMWRTGLIFGAAGMAGAFVGGLLGGHIPGQILLIAFAVMMVATSVAMLRGRKKKNDDGAAPVKHELPLGRVLLDGAVVGLVTGLVGAGGGFLVVPALALLGGLPMSVAVGTSLVVIAMKSFAGLAGYLTTVQLDWGITLGVTAAAIVGTLAGSKLAGTHPRGRAAQGLWLVRAVDGNLCPHPAGPGRPALVHRRRHRRRHGSHRRHLLVLHQLLPAAQPQWPPQQHPLTRLNPPLPAKENSMGLISLLKKAFSKPYKTISVAEAQGLLSSGAALIDVRSAQEWRSGGHRRPSTSRSTGCRTAPPGSTRPAR